MAPRRIDECTFAVVDVETTGIDAGRDRIVEVAVLTCDWAGRVADRYETLIRPDLMPLTGRRAEMLANAPTFADVAGDVVSRLAGHVVAGHNVSFDLRMIDAELSRIGARLPSHRYVCTRELATVLGCDVPNRTLAALCSYCGVPFERWHTAGDDTVATAAVLVHLLDRARGYGRLELAAIECLWTGATSEWPLLATGGRILKRDVDRWPPTGDKPGGKRATEASFRRLGEGPASPSGATLVTDGSQPTSASELWWEADLRGLEGIAQLEQSIVPGFRAADDPELVSALLALADLLRRHGGRDGEVRAIFAEAFAVSVQRGDAQPLARVVEAWWTYLAALRDTAALVALALGSIDAGLDAQPLIIDQIVRSRTAEPLVAEQLAREAIAAFAARQESGRAWDVTAALVDTLAFAGRVTDADTQLEAAWTSGCGNALVLDRLSNRLEQIGDYRRAAEVCARALAHGSAATTAASTPTVAAALNVLRKRHRRCQERLAREATLFG
jgi:DNA polymerase III epsilon subunit-like protein